MEEKEEGIRNKENMEIRKEGQKDAGVRNERGKRVRRETGWGGTVRKNRSKRYKLRKTWGEGRMLRGKVEMEQSREVRMKGGNKEGWKGKLRKAGQMIRYANTDGLPFLRGDVWRDQLPWLPAWPLPASGQSHDKPPPCTSRVTSASVYNSAVPARHRVGPGVLNPLATLTCHAAWFKTWFDITGGHRAISVFKLGRPHIEWDWLAVDIPENGHKCNTIQWVWSRLTQF